jgi:uncharacterized membrane protein YfcA
LAPAGFLLALVCLLLASLYEPKALALFVALFAPYLLWSVVASIQVARRKGWDLLPMLPLVFATYHFGYGYGFLRGLLDILVIRKHSDASEWTRLTRSSDSDR